MPTEIISPSEAAWRRIVEATKRVEAMPLQPAVNPTRRQAILSGGDGNGSSGSGGTNDLSCGCGTFTELGEHPTFEVQDPFGVGTDLFDWDGDDEGEEEGETDQWSAPDGVLDCGDDEEGGGG